MKNLFNKLIVQIALSVSLIVLLPIVANASNYYEEPSSDTQNGKLAYMAKHSYVLVGAIDNQVVFGKKSPQRLFPLEGAGSNAYLYVTPGKHTLKMRIFYQEFGGKKEISNVSTMGIFIKSGRIYYPVAEKTSLGEGKVKAVYTLIEAKSETELEQLLKKY